MTVDIVRHIDGDIALLGVNRSRRIVVTTYKVPSASTNIDAWKEQWNTKDGAGGWDESAAVQKQHKAFKQMGEVTNSASAFGGNGSSDVKTWIWIEDATKKVDSDSRLLENSTVEGESVEIEYFIG